MTPTSWVIRGARPLGAGPADIAIADETITAVGDGAGQHGAQALGHGACWRASGTTQRQRCPGAEDPPPPG